MWDIVRDRFLIGNWCTSKHTFFFANLVVIFHLGIFTRVFCGEMTLIVEISQVYDLSNSCIHVNLGTMFSNVIAWACTYVACKIQTDRRRPLSIFGIKDESTDEAWNIERATLWSFKDRNDKQWLAMYLQV